VCDGVVTTIDNLIQAKNGNNMVTGQNHNFYWIGCLEEILKIK